jgi:hypothetical protein
MLMVCRYGLPGGGRGEVMEDWLAMRRGSGGDSSVRYERCPLDGSVCCWLGTERYISL